jgi:SAM-dependent methyltransferase
LSPLDAANADQSAYWNGEPGRRWTALQDSQDRLFTPITAALFDAAALQPGEGVIDVGCGAGETTLGAAARTGAALGVDVSEPLLARARERAAAVDSPARRRGGECADFALWRDVFRRPGAQLRQSTARFARGRPARFRLLARAQAEPLADAALFGGGEARGAAAPARS